MGDIVPLPKRKRTPKPAPTTPRPAAHRLSMADLVDSGTLFRHLRNR